MNSKTPNNAAIPRKNNKKRYYAMRNFALLSCMSLSSVLHGEEQGEKISHEKISEILDFGDCFVEVQSTDPHGASGKIFGIDDGQKGQLSLVVDVDGSNEKHPVLTQRVRSKNLGHGSNDALSTQTEIAKPRGDNNVPYEMKVTVKTVCR